MHRGIEPLDTQMHLYIYCISKNNAISEVSVSEISRDVTAVNNVPCKTFVCPRG